jgi:hypothetical protein
MRQRQMQPVFAVFRLIDGESGFFQTARHKGSDLFVVFYYQDAHQSPSKLALRRKKRKTLCRGEGSAISRIQFESQINHKKRGNAASAPIGPDRDAIARSDFSVIR